MISHRGNLEGPNSKLENSPPYIDVALNNNYDAEIDVWWMSSGWYLGHDMPQYKVDEKWIHDRHKNIWIHAKNVDAIINLVDTPYNYFWHESDTVTLTSQKYIWAYPGKQKIKNSIAVMPEIYNDDISVCCGICTDYVIKYKKMLTTKCERI